MDAQKILSHMRQSLCILPDRFAQPAASICTGLLSNPRDRLNSTRQVTSSLWRLLEIRQRLDLRLEALAEIRVGIQSAFDLQEAVPGG